jgi:pSer/pThr/pTyr-binding forkhead associated (FHA) protein
MALQAGHIVIGRTTDNDLQIDSRLISRHHCQLVSTREYSVIEDMGSTNGIVVGGRRLKRHVLKDGDVVQLGAHAMRYANARQDDDIALPDLPPLEEGDVAA